MKKKISKEEQYKTLLVLVTGLVLIGLGGHGKRHFVAVAGVLIGIISLVLPVVGYYIVVGWNKIGQGLGYVNSRILLTLIFFFFLLPVSLAYRLTGKDPLRLKKSINSLYTDRNHQYTPGDLKNMW